MEPIAPPIYGVNLGLKVGESKPPINSLPLVLGGSLVSSLEANEPERCSTNGLSPAFEPSKLKVSALDALPMDSDWDLDPKSKFYSASFKNLRTSGRFSFVCMAK